MRVLALETSSSTGSVAVVDVAPLRRDAAHTAEVLASATARVSNAHGESLLPIVEFVMTTARIELAAIDVIAVGIGPGSFTGTRIAVATAKGIAIATGKPLRSVDAFAALAIDSGVVDAPVAVAIDARKGEVYVSVVRVEGDDVVTLVAPMHVAPGVAWSRIAEAGVTGDVAVAGDGVSLVPELAARARPRVGVHVPSAIAVAALGGARHRRAPGDEVDVLEPLYVRPPDITVPTRTPGLPR